LDRTEKLPVGLAKRKGVSSFSLLMNFSFPEIIFLMLLALILFGPKRLPEIARTWGKFMAEFKRASGSFQTQIQEEIRKMELEESDPSKHLAPAVGEIDKVINQADVTLNSALNRLTERIKGSVPQDFDA
jgi:Tat protein translocase TatB subunit